MDEYKIDEEAPPVENGTQSPAEGAELPPPPSKEEQEATQRKVGDDSIESDSLGKTNGRCKLSTAVFITFGILIGVSLLVTIIYFTVVLTDEEKINSEGNTAAVGLPGVTETTESPDDSGQSMEGAEQNGKMQSQPPTSTISNKQPNNVMGGGFNLKSLPRPVMVAPTTEKQTIGPAVVSREGFDSNDPITTTAPAAAPVPGDLKSLRGRPRPPAPTTTAEPETEPTTIPPINPEFNFEHKSLRRRPRPPVTSTPTSTTAEPDNPTSTVPVIPNLNFEFKSLRRRPRPPVPTITTMPEVDSSFSTESPEQQEITITTVAGIESVSSKQWRTLFTMGVPAAAIDHQMTSSASMNVTASSIKNGEDDETEGESIETGVKASNMDGITTE